MHISLDGQKTQQFSARRPSRIGCTTRCAVDYVYFCITGLVVVVCGWLGSRVISVLDSCAEVPGFKSQP